MATLLALFALAALLSAVAMRVERPAPVRVKARRK